MIPLPPLCFAHKLGHFAYERQMQYFSKRFEIGKTSIRCTYILETEETEEVRQAEHPSYIRGSVSAEHGGSLLVDPLIPLWMELVMDTQCNAMQWSITLKVFVLQLAAWRFLLSF